jgi:hypothetical protein
MNALKQLGHVAVLCLLTLIAFTTPAQAQNIKTVSWTEFWNKLELSKSDSGKREFVHEGRSLYNYTVVQVPAATLSTRFAYPLHSGDEMDIYLATASESLTVHFRDTVTNSETSRPASVRLMFRCKLKNSPVACREQMDSLLKKGVAMQSTGESNIDAYEISGIVPERLIFSFMLIP